MRTAAVIAEYNPFHNGHAYMLQEVRRLSGADFLLVVMSGDFVQRGTPAVFDKYTRTEMALAGGADLVLELPLAASCGSAPRFAEGAVRLLDSLGVVDELWFGSECGSMRYFHMLSGILSEEPEEYRALLRTNLASGMSFPKARAGALRGFLPDSCPEAELSEMISSPNNILGLEYCVALTKLHSKIRPCTIRRRGAGYHDTDAGSGEEFPSASAVRALLSGISFQKGSPVPDVRNARAGLSALVPAACLPLCLRELDAESILTEDDFSEMLLYRLAELKSGLAGSPFSGSSFLDVSGDLLRRAFRLLPEFRSFSQFAGLLKTRNVTRTQINRALLHLLLHLTEKDLEQVTAPSCARMLGMRHCPELLSEIKKKSRLPLITKASALSSFSCEHDLFASELYESVKSRKTGLPFHPEFSRSVIIR